MTKISFDAHQFLVDYMELSKLSDSIERNAILTSIARMIITSCDTFTKEITDGYEMAKRTRSTKLTQQDLPLELQELTRKYIPEVIDNEKGIEGTGLCRFLYKQDGCAISGYLCALYPSSDFKECYLREKQMVLNSKLRGSLIEQREQDEQNETHGAQPV